MLQVLTAESTVKAARITNPKSQMPRRGSGEPVCSPTGVAARAGSNAREAEAGDDERDDGARATAGAAQRRRAAAEPATASAPTIAAAV